MLIRLYIDEAFPVQPAKANGFSQEQEAQEQQQQQQQQPEAQSPPQGGEGGDQEDGAPPQEEQKKELRRILIMWLVEDNLPFRHERNIMSLLSALHQPKEKAPLLNNFQDLYLYLGTTPVNMDRSPKSQSRELGGEVAKGSVLTFSNEPPATPAEPEEDDDAASGNASPRSYSMAPGAIEGAATKEEEEHYVAEECGWFPFTFGINHYGQKVAHYINPDVEPGEDDPAPTQNTLCESCSDMVRSMESLTVKVDRHYKPMLMKMDVVEGWVEKLGGGTISRWQKRYLCASEKSLDWYGEKPKVGVKSKIKGNRMFIEDGACAAELIEHPDPVKFPKCKEPKYFHFGISFKADKTMLFRVASQAEKNKFVGFIKSTVGRIENKGASRDPVFWKMWADAFLTNASDVGELSNKNDVENDELADEVANLEHDLENLETEKPKLQATVTQKAAVVTSLQSELQVLQDRIAEQIHDAEKAEQKVEDEMALLKKEQLAMDEEMKQTAMMEIRTRQQKVDAEKKIKKLQVELEALEERQHALFAKWRKFEEHHADAKDAPSKKRYYSFSVDGVPRGQSSSSTLWRSHDHENSSLSRSPTATIAELQQAGVRSPSMVSKNNSGGATYVSPVVEAATSYAAKRGASPLHMQQRQKEQHTATAMQSSAAAASRGGSSGGQVPIMSPPPRKPY